MIDQATAALLDGVTCQRRPLRNQCGVGCHKRSSTHGSAVVSPENPPLSLLSLVRLPIYCKQTIVGDVGSSTENAVRII